MQRLRFNEKDDMDVSVYCSSSNHTAPAYFEAAERLGHAMAARGMTLVYGGGDIGLMGAAARAVHAAGGKVVGVIPEKLKAIEGVAYDVADEMHITQTMQERKRIIFTRADAFLVLPGGMGTLEEFFEVLTLKQLHYHTKAIVLLNVDGFFDPLFALFDHLYTTKMTRPSAKSLYHVATDVDAALDYLEQYVPTMHEKKW